jgi:catechol 2,3-dioxygenase-like lactoylglutathione lyase family enzyme
VDWTLELIVVPVSDVDRAKAFYTDQAGFNVLVDTRVSENLRVVRLCPPGSACAIAIGTGISKMEPGSLEGLHLIVPDLDAARDALVGRGAEVGESFHMGEGGQLPGPDPERQSYNSFFPFSDPDGNVWLVQEVKREWRLQEVTVAAAAS